MNSLVYYLPHNRTLKGGKLMSLDPPQVRKGEVYWDDLLKTEVVVTRIDEDDCGVSVTFQIGTTPDPQAGSGTTGLLTFCKNHSLLPVSSPNREQS